MRAHIIFFLVVSSFSTKTYSQQSDPKLAEFWQRSDYSVKNRLLSDGQLALYMSAIQYIYPSQKLSSILVRAETVSTDKRLQDYLFLRFLILYGHSPLLSIVLTDICGSEKLSVYVGDYIARKYSKDPRYLDVLATRKNETPEEKYDNKEEPFAELVTDEITDGDVIAPSFPGGEYGWSSYLRSELNKLPEMPAHNLEVTFMVNITGNIDSVVINNPTNTLLDQSIIHIFKTSPAWQPAIKKGRLVPSKKRQILEFAALEH